MFENVNKFFSPWCIVWPKALRDGLKALRDTAGWSRTKPCRVAYEKHSGIHGIAVRQSRNTSMLKRFISRLVGEKI